MRATESVSATEARRLFETDALLRLSPDLERSYEAETRDARVADLRTSIAVGLVFYTLFNLTSAWLLEDMFWTAIICRTLIIIPISIAIAVSLGYLDARMRERIITFGVTNALVFPVVLIWFSQSPTALYTIGEMFLTLVFGNMLMQLRFRHAICFSAIATAVTLAVLLTKSDVTFPLEAALIVQIFVAAAFTLYANWRAEHARCYFIIETTKAKKLVSDARQSVQEYRHLSMTDSLTGLPNRRALGERLARFSTEGEAIALVMVDVDYFKDYNDHFGHQAGDECLGKLAQALDRVARSENGIAARLGGEEFAVVVPAASEAEVERIAYLLMIGIRVLVLPHPARRDGVDIVTVSMGASWRPAHLGGETDLFSQADKALYRAKDDGRNRWRRAQSPLDQTPKRQAAA